LKNLDTYVTGETGKRVENSYSVRKKTKIHITPVGADPASPDAKRRVFRNLKLANQVTEYKMPGA
jgi:hypothetical protein